METQISISEKIKSNYIDYAVEVNTYRAIPSMYDGLKSVQRRLFLTGSKIARNSLVKSASIIGECMANYHPHGDLSLYNALVGLVNDPYPMFLGQGNWGDIETSPAAYRYTSVKLSEFMKDYYNSYMDYTEFMEGELGHTEQKYIPTKVPYALVNGTSGVGLGIATIIPSFTLDSILRYVIWLDSPSGKSEPELKINYPLYEIDDTVFMSGYGLVKYLPVYRQEDDKTFVITQHFPNINIKEILLKSFKSEIENKKVFIRDESGSNGIRIVIGKIWWININEIEKKIKKVTKSVTVNMNWATGTDKPLVRRLSPKQILEISLEKYMKSLDRWKQDTTQKLKTEIRFQKLKMKIVKKLISKEPWDQIQLKYKLSDDEISVFKSKSLNQLTNEFNESEYLEKIQKIENVRI